MIGMVSVEMWLVTHACCGAIRPAAEHGVAVAADGVTDAADEDDVLHGLRVEAETGRDVESLDGGGVADHALDRLADVGRRVRARRDQQGVSRHHPEGLDPALVDHGVDLRHLRRVGTDVHLGCVGAGTEPHEALLRDLLAEPLAQRHLTAGDPVPLGLERRHPADREVAVRRGVDRGDVDRVVLDAGLGPAELLDPGDAAQVPDPAHHPGAERLLSQHEDVRGLERCPERTGPIDRVVAHGVRRRRVDTRDAGARTR